MLLKSAWLHCLQARLRWWGEAWWEWCLPCWGWRRSRSSPVCHTTWNSFGRSYAQWSTRTWLMRLVVEIRKRSVGHPCALDSAGSAGYMANSHPPKAFLHCTKSSLDYEHPHMLKSIVHLSHDYQVVFDGSGNWNGWLCSVFYFMHGWLCKFHCISCAVGDFSKWFWMHIIRTLCACGCSWTMLFCTVVECSFPDNSIS